MSGICICGCYECTIAQVWKPEDNLWGSVVSFPHVGPRDQTQAIRIGEKCPSILNHLNHHRFISLGSAVMVLEEIKIIQLNEQELQF